MTLKIGFSTETIPAEPLEAPGAIPQASSPRKSVVQVHFPTCGMTLAYFNDRFDLHPGDLVYVDGKLEGFQGRITEVNYSFKIKLSDYKRVIALADTQIHGQFFQAGSQFVTFDRTALPAGKATSWFLPPKSEGEEYASGTDDSAFPLEDLSSMQVTASVAERGFEYYTSNHVKYLRLDGTKGYAIVEGNLSHYEVEFTYCGGEIRDLTCTCFCSFRCKHEFAVMLQLKALLEIMERHHAEEYRRQGYFAAIDKAILFSYAIDGRETGSFTL